MNLQVAIFEHRTLGKPCLESCGVDWLKEESQQVARECLRQRFGHKVEVGFYNLAEPAAQRKFPDVARLVEEQTLLPPLLIVNGRVRIAGFFDYRMLLDTVEAEEDLGLG